MAIETGSKITEITPPLISAMSMSHRRPVLSPTSPKPGRLAGGGSDVVPAPGLASAPAPVSLVTPSTLGGGVIRRHCQRVAGIAPAPGQLSHAGSPGRATSHHQA